MKRVYCKTCTYHQYYEDERMFTHYCVHKNSKIVNRNSLTEWISHKECYDRNKHNNCHDYKKKESLWNTVLAYFR